MGYRTYSDQEKAEALLALEANGGNLKGTARKLGIPLATLQKWRDGKVHRAVTQLCNGEREPLADRLEALAHKCLDVLPEKVEAATASQIAVALGVSLEKMRLLREQSTQNVRNENLTDGERVERLADLGDRLRTRRDRQPPDGASVVN